MLVFNLPVLWRHVSDIKRRFVLGSAAVFILLVTFSAVMPPASLRAAPAHAENARHDRRPDRERPVVTTTSPPHDGGTTQQGGRATTQSRPRLVRR